MAIKFLNTVQVDTDVLYVDAANDRVGIGTNSPSVYHKLDVNGSANFSADIVVGRNATALSFDMNPAYDSGNYYLKLYKNQSNDGGILLKSKVTGGNSQNDWQIVNQGTTGDLKFYAYGLGGNAFVLDRETGNLQLPEYGAGTLVSDASGNITVSSGGGAGGPYLPLSAGASYPLTGALNILIPGDPKLTLQSTSTDTSDWNYINFVGRDAVRDGYVGTDADGDIQVYSDKNSSSVQLTGSGIILNGGNVGIGITNPSTPLQVAGIAQIVTSSDNAFYGGNYVRVFGDQNYGFRNAAGTQIANISMSGNSYFNGGNVGIGTTSPIAKLHVLGTSANNATTKAEMLSNSVFSVRPHSTNSGTLAIAQVDGGDSVGMQFTNGAGTSNWDISLQPFGGRVGVGTTNPLQPFQVDAGSNIASFRSVGTGENNKELLIQTGGDRVTLDAKNADDGTATSLAFELGNSEKARLTTTGLGIGTTSPSEKLDVNGNVKIKDALLSNQENTDIDTGAEVVAQVAISYTAAFFDFVVKKGTNVRSGTVYACHDGTNVEFTETSTNDLGDTSDVTLSVDISGANMRLLATVTSDDWSVKSLIRAI